MEYMGSHVLIVNIWFGCVMSAVSCVTDDHSLVYIFENALE